jgi:hypothetical protein
VPKNNRMEKESADKAKTEFENSVTSEEQASSADNSDSKKVEEATPESPEKEEESVKSEKKTAEDDVPQKLAEEADNKPEVKGEASEEDEKQQDSSPAKTDEEIAEEPEKEEESVKSEQKTDVDVVPEKLAGEEKKEPEVKKEASKEDEKPQDSTLTDTPEELEQELKKEKKDDGSSDAVEAPEEKDNKPKQRAKVEEKTDTADGSVDETNVPEADLSEQAQQNKRGDDDDQDEFKEVDFSTYSKEELVEVVKKLGKDENPYQADRILQKIAPLFNKIRDEEKAAALKTFLAEGGSAEEFHYHPDELSLRFDANYKLIKDKKGKKFREQESERTKNLVLAEELLEELREFVDSDESSASFNQFKDLQEKWKGLGDVPSQSSRTLWANYNALINRFYDQRSIYFELKELDRKKNYEAKLKLCEKAEALVKVENLREAIRTLNDLHHEFKHLGPVPKEVQEELWQRFKAASDKVYDRRKAFVNELKEELHENQEKKEDLVDKIQVFRDFNSDRIKEWNEKTKEVLAIQKEWETIGGLPKDKAKEINKNFWGAFKKFFRNKHQFFKKLDADREENLVKKQEMLAKAVELKDSEDWEKTSNDLKQLQNEWREVGPVPEKMRKKLYEDFKAACDQFFDRRREGLKSSQDQYKANLKQKKEIIAKIAGLVDKADDNLDQFNELRKSFNELGYVPKKNIQSIKTEFKEVVEKFLNSVTTLNPKEKTEISLESEFTGLANAEHSQSELYHKEQSVRRQISKYEDDIALWQNNLEFFAHSKKTDKLRDEVNKKIDDAKVQLEALKRQLKMLRSL